MSSDLETRIAAVRSWNFQVTDWEINAAAELESLPVSNAIRLSPKLLAKHGMEMNQCHNNVQRWLQESNLSDAKAVVCWWVCKERKCTLYILHSVLEIKGHFCCVTPAPPEISRRIEIIIDPKIEYINGKHYRDGRIIGFGIRKDPHMFIEESNKIIEDLIKNHGIQN